MKNNITIGLKKTYYNENNPFPYTLDLAAVLLSRENTLYNGKDTAVIYPHNSVSLFGAIELTSTKEDPQVIHIDLDNIPVGIEKILVFALLDNARKYGQDLFDIENLSAHYDYLDAEDGNHIRVHNKVYSEELKNKNLVELFSITRYNDNEWNIQSVNNSEFTDLTQYCNKYIL